MWDLNDIEIETPGPGVHSFMFRMDLTEEFDAAWHLLVVQSAEDVPSTIEAAVDAPLDQISRLSSVKAFVGRVTNQAKTFTIRVFTKGAERIRIKWVRFLEWVGRDPATLSCNACKFLVQVIALAILSHLAVGVVAGSMIHLTPQLLASLESLSGAGALMAFLKLGATAQMYRTLKSAWSVLDGVFQFSDALWTRICRELGFCGVGTSGSVIRSSSDFQFSTGSGATSLPEELA